MNIFNALFQFEWRYHIHQKSFLFGTGLFFAMGFLFPIAQADIDARVFMNAPHNTALYMAMLSLPTVFVLAVIISSGMLRDVSHNAVQLVYSTPVSKGQLLFSRFAGSFVASFLVYLAAPIGMIAATFYTGLTGGTVLPINPLDHLWVLATLILPTMFFLAAILVTVALLTRSQLATLVAALFIYLSYFMGAIFVGSPLIANPVPASPEAIRLASLLDPFGLSAFLEQVKNWSINDRNTRLFALHGDLLLNRLCWLAASTALMAVLYRVFNLKILQSSRKPKRRHAGTVESEVPNPSLRSITYSHVSPFGQSRPQLHAFLSMFRLESRYVFLDIPFLAVLFLWVLAAGTEYFAILSSTPFSTPVLPTTAALLARIQYDVLPNLASIVIIFYSGEVMWRERGLNVSAFTNSAPAGNLAFFASKFVVLGAIPAVLICVAIIQSVLIQVMVGYHDFEPMLYLSVFYYGGLPLLLLAALAIFCQSITPNRYLGMLLCGALYYLPGAPIGPALGMEHPLFAFGEAPTLSYSNMSGYDRDAHSWASYMLCWSALAGLFAWATWKLWPRSSETRGIYSLVRTAFGRWTKPEAAAIAGLIAIFVTSGSIIFYKTNIDGNYLNSKDARESRVAYEKAYKKYDRIAQPIVNDISNTVDLYPEDKRFSIMGNFELVNQTEETIEDVLVFLDPDLDVASVSVDGANLREENPDLGQRIFRLAVPMAPGQKTRLRYDFSFEQNGFKRLPQNINLVDNGTFVSPLQIMPKIGYQANRELRSPGVRQEHGLPENPAKPSIDNAVGAASGPLEPNLYKVTQETILSTSLDQTAITVGELVRTWQEGERRYFHYRTARPANNVAPIASARYEIRRGNYKGVQTGIYYSPSKTTNVDSVQKALEDALDYCGEQFGAYPLNDLRVVQVSSQTGINGYAAPGMLLMGEQTVFNFDVSNKDILTDHTYRVTAHEVAHQWWGHQLVPATYRDYEGAMTLVETLARYTELMMLERKFGPGISRRWVGNATGRYLAGRASNTRGEVPLYRVGDQRYIMYSKGAIAMYAIRQLIGEDEVNNALRSLITDFAGKGLAATSLDLVAALHRVSDSEHHPLIDDWFKRIVLFEVAAWEADVNQLDDGSYTLEIPLFAKKSEVDSIGVDTEVAFDQKLEIEVTLASGKEVFTKSVVSGDNVIRLTLADKPISLSLDPAYRLLDTNRSNNILEL